MTFSFRVVNVIPHKMAYRKPQLLNAINGGINLMQALVHRWERMDEQMEQMDRWIFGVGTKEWTDGWMEWMEGVSITGCCSDK